MNAAQRLRARLGVGVVLSVGMVGSSFAALPQGALDAFTALQTDGQAMIDAGWPVAVAVTVGLIMIGLFKKVGKKSAS